MFINAKIQTDKRMVKALPESAILRKPEGNFILILEKQNNKEVVFKQTAVRLGAMRGQNIEVLSSEYLNDSMSIVISKGHFLSDIGGTVEE